MVNRKLEKAKEMINKRVVIGITYLDPGGEAIDSTQMYGKVISVNPDSVKVELEGSHKGEIFSLPRDLRAFHKAEPGTYTLKCSGEEVEDPDYTTVWNITKSPEGKG
jgi:hypothetical protein